MMEVGLFHHFVRKHAALLIMAARILRTWTTRYGAIPPLSFLNQLFASIQQAFGSICLWARTRVTPWLPPTTLVSGLTQKVLIKFVSFAKARKGENQKKQFEKSLQAAASFYEKNCVLALKITYIQASYQMAYP